MIADLDASLIAWLGQFVPEVEIRLSPPPEPAGSGDAPCLLLFLATVRTDPDAGEPGWVPVHNASGVVVGRGAPLRTYRLAYLITAFAADPRVEHEILGHVLAGAAEQPILPDSVLRGAMQEVERDVLALCAPERATLDPAEWWAGWGVRPRAFLELTVLSPVPRAAMAAVPAPPGDVHLGVARMPKAPAKVAVERPAPPRATVTEPK